MREVIFPRDDQVLADALREISRLAGSANVRFFGWEGFEHAAVRKFLDSHPPSAPA